MRVGWDPIPVERLASVDHALADAASAPAVASRARNEVQLKSILGERLWQIRDAVNSPDARKAHFLSRRTKPEAILAVFDQPRDDKISCMLHTNDTESSNAFDALKAKVGDHETPYAYDSGDVTHGELPGSIRYWRLKRSEIEPAIGRRLITDTLIMTTQSAEDEG